MGGEGMLNGLSWTGSPWEDTMRSIMRLAGAIMLAGVPAGAATGPAAADSYPDRTIRIIVPTSPGGSIDGMARTVAAKLSAKWGKPVVVENRSGAAMRLGADAVAKAPPDGYTLLVAHDGAMAMNPAIYSDPPYDSQKDFAPIALMAAIPEVILAHAKAPGSLAELIDFARKNPGKLNHATGGPASRLALELFKSMAGVDIASVQYRGAAPSVMGVIAGEVQLCITDIASASPALQSDQVRALAVTTRNRAQRFPNLPTAHEAGLPGYDVQVWIGIFAPSAAPKDIVEKIGAGVRETLAAPDIREKLEALGMELRSGTASELRDTLAADIPKWSRLVKDNNLQLAQ
jgi:tripartite-type tricarboxylate transporter receptor subunit TctC